MKLRMGRRTGLLSLASVAAVTLSMIGGGPLAAATTRAAAPLAAAQHAVGYQPPKIGHVWTIILENKSYEATFTGLNQNDYLWKTLPSYGELLRQYYGTGHYSLDNYISLVGGLDRSRFGGHPRKIAAAPEHRRLTDGFDPEKLH